MTSGEIWEKFSRKLLAFIKSKVSSQSDAEDLMQDVFLKIHDNLDKLNNLSKVESWIFQITRNTINDYYRKSRFDETYLEEESFPAEKDKEIQKDIKSCLTGLADQLPEKYRIPLKEVYLKGRKQTELAGDLGLTYPGLKSRVQRGRELLKNNLKSCCDVKTVSDFMDCDC